jgi:quercetin dioxygenase-like cupin family protein
MLSQVERGETSPTLQVATKIAAGLDLTLSQLLRLDEDTHVSVVRQAEAPVVRLGARHSMQELTPSIPGQPHSVTRHTLRSLHATGGAPLHEPGGRETVVVLTGTVQFVCDDKEYTLQAGDAVTFDADLPHHFKNEQGGAAEFIAVVTSGLRRA